ncbi:hypothetical protein JOQ06_026124, partial [Pogonophryne albipinna]
VEVKEAEVQQLQEEGQRMETSLQTLREEVEVLSILSKRPLVSRQKFEEEQQRREEAERKTDALLADIKTLKDEKQKSENIQKELEATRKEVHLPWLNLNSLSCRISMQRNEKELQSLKGDLENKNREVPKYKEKKRKETKAKQEVETLKTKLETQQEETDTNTRELCLIFYSGGFQPFEDKRAGVQQLQKEVQRMETSLQTLMESNNMEDLQTNNMEVHLAT